MASLHTVLCGKQACGTSTRVSGNRESSIGPYDNPCTFSSARVVGLGFDDILHKEEFVRAVVEEDMMVCRSTALLVHELTKS